MAMPGLGGRMRMRQLWGWTNRRKQLDGSNSMLDSLRAGSMLISQARSKTISCGAARFDKIVQRDRMQSYKMASNRMGQGNWTCANTGSNKMGCETQGHAFMSTSSHAWPRNAQMNPGSMVIFTRSDSSKAEREIALVKGPARGGKFILLETDAGGAQIAVRRSNVKISLPDPPEGSWSVDSVKTLREEAQSLCDSVQQDHLKQLWEDMRVENEERVVELGDLADNLFKDKSACSMFAAYSTAARFRSLFTPLNNGLVLVHSEEKEEHDLTKRTESLPCLEKLISKISAHLESQRREGMSGSQMKVEEDEEELLVHLEQYAMGLRTLEGLPKLMQVLVYQRVLKSETTSDPRLVAADLLFGIRYWIPGENIHLKRYLKLFYVSSALEAKAELAAANPAADVLEGLRKRMGSVAFAVDDSAENIDIDDAVGLQYEEDGEWLMVHVADPARLCLQDTELDKLAQERASTVYLPEMRIPMLPMSLTRSSSLEEERDNDGLTFSVRLSHSGDIEEYKIVPSRVVNVRKTTYSQVDEMLTWRPEEMLEGEGGRGDADKVKSSFILQRLMSLAKRRMSFRMLNGAVPTEIPKAQVRVWDEEVNGEKRKEVKVEPSTQTPARMMIAEFMLLAGEVAARFAQERRVPFVYRTQLPVLKVPDFPDLDRMRNEACRNFQQVLLMKPAVNLVMPAPHSGLGLSLYSQVTSPIRRYMDLLLHRQLRAALLGTAPAYSTDRVHHLITKLDRKVAAISRLQRNSERFWILEFLRRKGIGVTLPGTVLRSYNPIGQVSQVSILLDELGHIETVRETGNPPKVGAKVVVVVKDCNPVVGTLKLVLLRTEST